MHRELVERDQWVDETRFRKVLALYQALPGPEAHELAVYFGMTRCGRWGGFLTGLAFMLPGVVLVTLLAWLYTLTADTARIGQELLYGVRPAVIALLAYGFVKLARRSIDSLTLALIAAGAAVAAWFLPALFLAILLVGGLVALGVHLVARRSGVALGAIALLGAPAMTLVGLSAIALIGLKAGLLSFGGAYAAMPFLQQGFVEGGWLTDAQFLDALALSSLLPAPLIAVGTFLGFLVAGLPGALVMSVAIFAPAFAFTLVGHEHFERLVDDPRLHQLLLGVTAAVIGLIAATGVALGAAALTDAWTAGIGAAAFVALVSGRVPIPVVILAAAAVGWMARAAGVA